MGAALSETRLTDIAQNGAKETYLFQRDGEEYPFVDVSFLLRAVKNRARIVTDGPYRATPLSPGSNAVFRERPANSPNASFAMDVPQEMREEVAASIANLLFEIAKLDDAGRGGQQ